MPLIILLIGICCLYSLQHHMGYGEITVGELNENFYRYRKDSMGSIEDVVNKSTLNGSITIGQHNFSFLVQNISLLNNSVYIKLNINNEDYTLAVTQFKDIAKYYSSGRLPLIKNQIEVIRVDLYDKSIELTTLFHIPMSKMNIDILLFAYNGKIHYTIIINGKIEH